MNITGIDLSFRPASYVDFDDALGSILNGIAGQMRRDTARLIASTQCEDPRAAESQGLSIPDAILADRLDAESVQALSGFGGPAWMGGEYLPRHHTGEVEIARVVLASVTMDVTSLRARWSGGRYHYRVVDEYDNDFRLPRKTSRRTLTLGQVIEIIQKTFNHGDGRGAGLVEIYWKDQFDYGDYAEWPEGCTDFARVESEIYPDLTRWYAARAAEWCEEHRRVESE